MPKKPTPAPKTVKPDQIILAIDRRRDAVLDVIRAARERLLISMFRCTDVPVLDAIAEALNRKVDVRLLITPRARGWQKRLKELGAYLESMGAKVHPYSDPVVKYHAKYVLADDGPALVGSLNFTAKCFAATCDFILITHDPDMIASLKDLFEVDWLAPHSSFPSRLSHRLIVGPDRARAQFTAMLEDAKRSIYLIDHKLDDPTIKAILKAKKAAGVELRVLGEGQLGGMLSHGKLIIVDGRVAAIGAMALSALSLDFRREVSVKVDDARCIRKLRDFFNTMAQESERMNGGRARGNARARKTHA